jgi:hypothetical protein
MTVDEKIKADYLFCDELLSAAGHIIWMKCVQSSEVPDNVYEYIVGA